MYVDNLLKEEDEVKSNNFTESLHQVSISKSMKMHAIRFRYHQIE